MRCEMPVRDIASSTDEKAKLTIQVVESGLNITSTIVLTAGVLPMTMSMFAELRVR